MSTETVELVEISICTDPWETVEVDAFVCPTNSEGRLSEYPGSKIRKLAGIDVETPVAQHAPIAVGAAVVTEAGNMRAKHLVHVPDTDVPGGKVRVEDVLRATAAALVACEVKGFSSLAIPLMGAFETGIPAEEAARAIHGEVRAFRATRPMRVLLLARDMDELEVFEMAIEAAS